MGGECTETHAHSATCFVPSHIHILHLKKLKRKVIVLVSNMYSVLSVTPISLYLTMYIATSPVTSTRRTQS